MWFLFALLSAFFTGLQSFLNKVSAERNCDSYHVGATSSIVTFITALLVFFFTSSSLTGVTNLVWWLGVASGVLYMGRTITQLEALRFMDAAVFFPLYKVIGPIFVTVLGVWLLKDVIAPHELLGIVLSCIVPLLLITRAEHQRQKNLPLGLILMLASTALAAATAGVNAYAVQPGVASVIPFMTIAYGFSAIIGCMLYMRRLKPKEMISIIQSQSSVLTLSIGAGIGITQYLSFYFLLLAFIGSDLSIVYSIHAHYILIPVLLAVWLYKEHWNKQKAIALMLSLLALVLLHR